jgi:hypothetical protein
MPILSDNASVNHRLNAYSYDNVSVNHRLNAYWFTLALSLRIGIKSVVYTGVIIRIGIKSVVYTGVITKNRY